MIAHRTTLQNQNLVIFNHVNLTIVRQIAKFIFDDCV